MADTRRQTINSVVNRVRVRVFDILDGLVHAFTTARKVRRAFRHNVPTRIHYDNNTRSAKFHTAKRGSRGETTMFWGGFS